MASILHPYKVYKKERQTATPTPRDSYMSSSLLSGERKHDKQITAFGKSS